jgi:hypothetical protein
MTLASAIITAAYRELNLVALNDTPTTAELAEALPRLNAYIDSVVGFEIGENLTDWQVPAPQRTAPVAANYPQMPYPMSADTTLLPFPLTDDPGSDIFLYPPRNCRIYWGGTCATTVYFPEAPDPGTRMGLVAGPEANPAIAITLDGNGKFIQAPPLTGGTNGAQYVPPLPVTPSLWMYRDDLGTWLPIVDLAATDNMPFPEDFDDFFIVTLAMRIAPRYNKSVSAESQKAGMDALKRLKARYRQQGTTVYGSTDFPRSLQSYISGRWYY